MPASDKRFAAHPPEAPEPTTITSNLVVCMVNLAGPISSEGLRPSDSPTASLAGTRFAARSAPLAHPLSRVRLVLVAAGVRAPGKFGMEDVAVPSELAHPDLRRVIRAGNPVLQIL